MKHHPIFDNYESKVSVGTGKFIYDFLGVATDVSFKHGWDKWAVKKGSDYRPQYPAVNEHYFDWIALLDSIERGAGTFRMAELGAGWAPWLVRASFAVDQKSNISDVQLLGVEAEPSHYDWMKQHFLDNSLLPSRHHLIHGAVAAESTILKFPVVENPTEDYGASLRQVNSKKEFMKVRGYTLESLFERFDGPIDFLHSDIQGIEYDVFPPNMELVKQNVKNIMIGTHISTEKHEDFKKMFLDNGWEMIMSYPRMEEVDTEYGKVQFGDGFLYFHNPSF